MNIYETLSLVNRFKSAHYPLSNSRRLVRKFGTIIRILRSVVNCFGDQFSMGNAITFQLVRHNRSRRLTMRLQQPFEEFLNCNAVATALQKHIDDFSILVDGSPQIVLDTTDLDENLVDIESVAETLVPAPQSSCILRSKFIAP